MSNRLLDHLASQGVRLTLDGAGGLAIEGPQECVDAALELVRENKADIITHLRGDAKPDAPQAREAERPPVPPCPSDVTERSAIIALGDAVDGTTADERALAEHGFCSWPDLAAAHASRVRDALERLPTLADPDAARLARATRTFLDAPWFACAVECGWSLEELFGVDAYAPKVRVEHLGLVPHLTWSALRGVKLEAVTADGHSIRTASGSLLQGRRATYHAARQVLWWQLPALSRGEGARHAA